jgi:hypothetical protein
VTSWILFKLFGSSEVLQKVYPFFVGATLLQRSLEIIQYPLPAALEGNQFPLAKDQRALATLWQMYAICKSFQYPLRYSSEVANTLGHPKKIYQKVFNTLWPPVTNLPEDCQQPLTHLREGCPENKQRSNLFATPLKKVKFTLENMQTEKLKYYQRFITKECSIHLYHQ